MISALGRAGSHASMHACAKRDGRVPTWWCIRRGLRWSVARHMGNDAVEHMVGSSMGRMHSLSKETQRCYLIPLDGIDALTPHFCFFMLNSFLTGLFPSMCPLKVQMTTNTGCTSALLHCQVQLLVWGLGSDHGAQLFGLHKAVN